MIDCATSVTQRGKIEVYARKGEAIPEGWVIGEDGQYRTDTEQILVDLVEGKAALTPLGGLGEQTAGYKGYGYAMVIEMLSAALQQGAFLKALSGYDAEGERIPYPLGHFFLAINVESFTDLDAFRETTGDICRALRNSRKAPGAQRIWTPGEKEHDAWLERSDKGVPFGESLRAEFRTLREELELTQHELPF
jgi:LDH2 family malate/lactate/ureidoglycolate dehydrogenase